MVTKIMWGITLVIVSIISLVLANGSAAGSPGLSQTALWSGLFGIGSFFWAFVERVSSTRFPLSDELKKKMHQPLSKSKP